MVKAFISFRCFWSIVSNSQMSGIFLLGTSFYKLRLLKLLLYEKRAVENTTSPFSLSLFQRNFSSKLNVWDELSKFFQSSTISKENCYLTNVFAKWRPVESFPKMRLHKPFSDNFVIYLLLTLISLCFLRVFVSEGINLIPLVIPAYFLPANFLIFLIFLPPIFFQSLYLYYFMQRLH